MYHGTIRVPVECGAGRKGRLCARSVWLTQIENYLFNPPAWSELRLLEENPSAIIGKAITAIDVDIARRWGESKDAIFVTFRDTSNYAVTR